MLPSHPASIHDYRLPSKVSASLTGQEHCDTLELIWLAPSPSRNPHRDRVVICRVLIRASVQIHVRGNIPVIKINQSIPCLTGSPSLTSKSKKRTRLTQ